MLEFQYRWVEYGGKTSTDTNKIAIVRFVSANGEKGKDFAELAASMPVQVGAWWGVTLHSSVPYVLNGEAYDSSVAVCHALGCKCYGRVRHLPEPDDVRSWGRARTFEYLEEHLRTHHAEVTAGRLDGNNPRAEAWRAKQAAEERWLAAQERWRALFETGGGPP